MRDCPFTVFVEDGECFLSYATGGNPMVKPSELKEIMPLLEKYIEDHTDEEVEQENINRIAEYEAGFRAILNQNKNAVRNGESGYVYLLECGGKYKIGFSNNVERRIKQLDTRPFELKLICKVYSDIAFKVEQELHRRFSNCKVTGEWYKFNFVANARAFEMWVKAAEKNIKERT